MTGVGDGTAQQGSWRSALLLGLAVAWGPWPGPAVQAQDRVSLSAYPMRVEHHVTVPVADGVRLSADVFRPMEDGTYPTIFSMTPYNNNDDGSMDDAWSAVRRGYAVVQVDARGRYDSEGEFFPYRHDGPDGSDVMDWIAAQPWSDGTVATRGASYLGKNQWLMARENNPHHRAIVAYVAGSHEFLDGARYSGVPKLDLRYTWIMGMDGHVNQSRTGWDWNRLMWELPLLTLDEAGGRTIPAWRDLMSHDSLDAFWQPSGLMPEDFEGASLPPSLSVTGWYEGQLRGAVANHMNALAHASDPSNHVLLIGPWLHGVNRNRVVGERDAGSEAIIDLEGLTDAWLDHRMLRGPDPGLRGFHYFLPARNEWRVADAFPVPGTEFTEYWLDSGGGANTLAGDGTLDPAQQGSGPPDAYTYDPAHPVLTTSSRTSGSRGGLPQGSVDNRSVETREDVLVYTSAPLERGLEITGPVRARIYFSTDVEDTDITVKLLDVTPEGRALNLTEGIARAKYRSSYIRPEPLRPGEVYGIDVELFPTSNWFQAGHRIRIEVSSSDFPNFARNLNHMDSDTESRIAVAHTRIHHSADYASHILLPVIPEGATRRWQPPLRQPRESR